MEDAGRLGCAVGNLAGKFGSRLSDVSIGLFVCLFHPRPRGGAMREKGSRRVDPIMVAPTWILIGLRAWGRIVSPFPPEQRLFHGGRLVVRPLLGVAALNQRNA